MLSRSHTLYQVHIKNINADATPCYYSTIGATIAYCKICQHCPQRGDIAYGQWYVIRTWSYSWSTTSRWQCPPGMVPQVAEHSFVITTRNKAFYRETNVFDIYRTLEPAHVPNYCIATNTRARTSSPYKHIRSCPRQFSIQADDHTLSNNILMIRGVECPDRINDLWFGAKK